EEGRPVASRQVDAAHRALEEDVAGEERVLAADRIGHVAGAVTGGEEDVQGEPGELELIPARDSVIGVVALEGPKPGPGYVVHDVREHYGFELGAVDGRAGGLGDRSNGSDVVEVGVGEEDRLDLDAELLRRSEQPLGLVARIDDHGPVGVL